MSAETRTLEVAGLRAAFAPELAMIGCSLEHEGEEFLHLGDGLDAYGDRGSTMGIPLLHPWANRLAGPLPASPLLHRDPNGLPIHGVLPRALPFAVRDATPTRLVAEFDTHDHPDVLEVYRHPHALTVEASLSAEGLEVRTTMFAHSRRPVPIAFGYHPYLRLPGVPRTEWMVEIPARTRLELDERMLPTGGRERIRIAPAPLAARTFDDAYADLGPRPRFAAEHDGRSVAIEFVEGYEFAQVYTPAGAEFICFEPMTAPTNALATGTGLTWLRPGESFTAAFRITIT